jgi:rod shape-determining protein MreC
MPNGVQYIPGDPFANISAKPLINFDNTRELLLLWRTGPLPSAVVSPPPVEQAAEAAAKPKPAEQVPAKDPKKKENKPEAKPDNKPTASNKPTERPQ